MGVFPVHTSFFFFSLLTRNKLTAPKRASSGDTRWQMEEGVQGKRDDMKLTRKRLIIGLDQLK